MLCEERKKVHSAALVLTSCLVFFSSGLSTKLEISQYSRTR